MASQRYRIARRNDGQKGWWVLDDDRVSIAARSRREAERLCRRLRKLADAANESDRLRFNRGFFGV